MVKEDLHHEYEIAMDLYEDGDYADALALLNRIAHECPDSKHVMYGRGLCLIALGRVVEAQAIRDRLVGHKEKVARQLLAKLDAKLHEKLNEMEKAARKARGRSRSSVSSISDPRSSRSTVAVIILAIVAALAGALVIHMRYERTTSEESIPEIQESETPFAGTDPDQYVEAATFLPTGSRETAFRFAVFLSPPTRDVSNAPTDAQEDCAGGPAVVDWTTVKTKIKKALGMSNSSDEMLKGVPRNKLVCTVVLPRSDIALTGRLEGKSVETFAPGSAKDLASVIKACGKPERTEVWTQSGPSAGIAGEIRWWGRLGLAADATGQISHVLLQAYPGDKR